MTQEEIEGYFTGTYKTELRIRVEELLANWQGKGFEEFYELVDVGYKSQDEKDKLLADIFVTLYNEEGQELSGSKLFLDDAVQRVADVLMRRYRNEDYVNLAKSATRALKALDKTFFFLSWSQTRQMEPYPVVSLHSGLKQLRTLLPRQRGSTIAMIHKPRMRDKNGGGLLTIDEKYILNMKDSEQNASEAQYKSTNILQENAWRTTKNFNLMESVDFIAKSMIKKGTESGLAFSLARQKSEYVNRLLQFFGDVNVYFPWNRDFRGRHYCTNYMVSPHGDKIAKGTVIPENKKKITKRGMDWLYMNLANLFGDDKMLNDEKLKKWSSMTMEELRELRAEAESPLEYANALDSLSDAIETGECSALVYLDASNQALQLYAVLTADKDTAKLCNLANGEEMADAYRMLADEIDRIEGKKILERSHTKKALMTMMYGKIDCAGEVAKAMFPMLPKDEARLEINRLYGHPDPEGDEQTQFEMTFDQAVQNLIPHATRTMERIQATHTADKLLAKWKLPGDREINAYTIDEQEFEKDISMEIEGMEANISIRRRIKKRGPNKHSRAISPNVIHSIDAMVADNVTTKMNEEGRWISTIFDAFGAHPNDCDRLIEIYKEELIEILNSNLLEEILEQLGESNPMVARGELTEDDIRNSRYALN